ncbi:hypothetical protein [Pseudooceanicola sp. 200-1SW]|uniref:hypothetical protein n=1 Tax=Pseudooceanicola sp. 200-1SW TaxID=3425949 RepID=UPI003D7F2AA5
MAVVGLHLFTNWRPFRNSLRKPLAATILALGVVVTMLTSINLTPQSGPQLNPAQVFGALSRAPVATLAQLGGQSPEAYMAALGDAGFDGVTAQSTLTELTGGDRARNSQALALALATPAEQP